VVAERSLAAAHAGEDLADDRELAPRDEGVRPLPGDARQALAEDEAREEHLRDVLGKRRIPRRERGRCSRSWPSRRRPQARHSSCSRSLEFEPVPADKETVDLNRTALTAVRIGALALAGIAATAGVSWAASHGVPTTGTTPTVTRVAPPAPLVVPDVRKLAFVFAKGELEDAGFAWTVAGSVHGYAANTVVSQTPAPGTKVVDTGAPLVTVTLRRAAGYPQTGEAADSSPYPSTALQLAATGTR